MKVVAVTGGLGSGKSTVSAMLGARGAHVIDSDAVVRELQAPGQPVFEAMVERFGTGIVAADGTLDRKAVAAIVFTDPAALADLNGIVHPALRAEVLRRIAAHAGTDDVVVVEAPLFAETDDPLPVTGVVVVDAPDDERVRRVVSERGMGEADARARIATQASREDRLAVADQVVRNDGPLEAVAAQVDEAWAWIRSLPDT